MGFENYPTKKRSSEEFLAMRESVTEQTDENEESYGSCKVFSLNKIMILI